MENGGGGVSGADVGARGRGKNRGPLRSWGGLGGGSRADRERGGIGRWSWGQPGLLPVPGLNFPARAIFEKLIFNDTSGP